MPRAVQITLTGTDYSETVPLKDETIIRIGMPSEWQTADIWIEEQSQTGGKWRPIFDQFGDRIAIPARADQSLKLDPTVFVHYDRLRFQSSQIQTSPRSLVVMVAKLSELVSTGVA